MSLVSRPYNVVRAGVRAALRKALSQQRRTELKQLQGLARKRFAPMLSLVHGKFNADDLAAEVARRLPADFEILMVHSAYDGLLPMYTGSASQLVAALTNLCGPDRTLVMPAWVMGGRNFDTEAYFRTRPFDVRRTPSELGLLSEAFRRTPGVLRGLHPTCSLCALGPMARELTVGDHLAPKSFGPGSPFGLMTRRRTAILGLGVEYYRCLSHVHTAKDELGDAFPIKFAKGSTMPMTLVDYDGSRIEYQLGVPSREQKMKRAPELDLRLLWSLLSKDELVEWRFHGVQMFVVTRAGIVTERLVEAARRGITIYGRVSGSGDLDAVSRRQATESEQ
jgi:aminoglycoside 3-N-acetyltransferase